MSHADKTTNNPAKNERIIELLKEKEGYLSGAEIASALGVTRAAIWKRINALRKKGYFIEGSPTKGYKLMNSPELSLETIRSAISKESLKIGRDLIFYDNLSSTNTAAVELAQKGYPEGTVIIADEQTSGKGRLGRTWISPKGKNLHMSIILQPSISPREATILTLMSAVSCCIALRKLLSIPISIKWPNDLMVNDKKIGGILTEINADIDKIAYAVIGIGININLDIENLPEDVMAIATSIKNETGEQFSRTAVVIEVLREIQKWYDILLRKGKKDILSYWRDLSSTIKREVKVTMENKVFMGVAEGIDEEGLLILKLPDNSLMKVNAGDITMLRERGK